MVRGITVLLGNFANMLGGSAQQGLVDSGASALSSLLGGGSTNAIASAVGKYAGVSEGQGKSLLGMLAPVVLGTLANQQKTQGLDAGGLASLLNGQKGNIAAAMPAGFSDLLKGSGVLDSINAELPKAGAERRTQAPIDVEPSAPAGGGILKYLLPLAAAAALLYALSGYGCNRQPEMKTTAPTPAVEKPAVPAAQEKAAAPSVAVPGAELTTNATKTLQDLMATLGGVKDEATAKSSLSKLQDLAGQIDKLKGTAMGLPADARHPLVVMISGMMPGLAASIDKALAIPGVGAVLKPVLDQIAGSLGVIAKS